MDRFKPSLWQGARRFTRSYELTTDALTIRWGIVPRRHNRIPRGKITNVDLGINYLLPGRSSVRVNVGSGEPVICNGLSRRSARALAASLRHAEM
jgi:PH (Pleckstrin Homology) domain-containing protein